MSAAARIVVEITNVAPQFEADIKDKVLQRISGTGLPTSEGSTAHMWGADFSLVCGTVDNGKIQVSLDARSMSVSWDVLTDAFAESFVRDVYAVDSEAETSVYVYNLDVEPDFEFHTSSMATLGMLDTASTR
jgi:hypothetical protein